MAIPNAKRFALLLGLIMALVCQLYLRMSLPLSSFLLNSDSGIYVTGTVTSRLKFGLTVIHCKESMARMNWIKHLPKQWNVTVYETCGANISAFSRPYENGGSEECSAYLNTMIEHYHDPHLPDINVFVQSDVLLAGGREDKRLRHEHSPFYNITHLVNTVETWAETNGSGKFLHFGPEFGRSENIAEDWNYQKDYPRQIMDAVERKYTSESFFQTRSGACFAVHKDRILANSKDAYVKLKEKQLSFKGSDNTNKFCCAFENAWHAILGEPFILPNNSSVDHIWHERVRVLPDGWEHQLQKEKKKKR